MARFTRSDDLQAAEFVDVNLRGARFVGADLSGAVMRGVQVDGAEIDAPWLFDGDDLLLSTASTWRPFVDAELNRRFPGRAERRATDPDGLRQRGPRSSAPGRPPWSASRPCRPARSTSRSPASGRSRRRCGTWCWPPTSGWAGRSSRSSSPSTPSACATPAEGDGAGHVALHRARARRTTRCSTCGPTGSRWCATSLQPSPPSCWRRRAEPSRPVVPRDRALVPAHHPRRGVGAPPLRRPRPRRDRRRARRPTFVTAYGRMPCGRDGCTTRTREPSKLSRLTVGRRRACGNLAETPRRTGVFRTIWHVVVLPLGVTACISPPEAPVRATCGSPARCSPLRVSPRPLWPSPELRGGSEAQGDDHDGDGSNRHHAGLARSVGVGHEHAGGHRRLRREHGHRPAVRRGAAERHDVEPAAQPPHPR